MPSPAALRAVPRPGDPGRVDRRARDVRRVDGRRPDGIRVELLPTFVGCPALEVIREAVEDRLAEFRTGRSAVEVTFDALESDRITPEGRAKLRRPVRSAARRWYCRSLDPMRVAVRAVARAARLASRRRWLRPLVPRLPPAVRPMKTVWPGSSRPCGLAESLIAPADRIGCHAGQPDRTASRDAPPATSASSGRGRWERGSPRSRSRPATGWSSTIRTRGAGHVAVSGSPMGCSAGPEPSALPAGAAAGPLDPGRALTRLRSASDLGGLAAASEVVVEAVAEDLELKRRLFATLDAAASRRRCWPRTRARCPSRPSPRRRAARAGSSACISSTRRRSCRSSRSWRRSGQRSPQWTPRSSSSGTGGRRRSAARTRPASSSTG